MVIIEHRIFSLLEEIFRKHIPGTIVRFGILSFTTLTLMGLTCLFTYMGTSHDYAEKIVNERTKLLADTAIKVSFLEGELRIYRDAFSALSKSSKRMSLGLFNVTAYDPIDGCRPFDDNMTATLLPAGTGVAAVDPRVIPYGSVLYLPELNRYFFACDTGADVKKNGGRNIDLLLSSAEAAREFGRQTLEIELIDLSQD